MHNLKYWEIGLEGFWDHNEQQFDTRIIYNKWLANGSNDPISHWRNGLH